MIAVGRVMFVARRVCLVLLACAMAVGVEVALARPAAAQTADCASDAPPGWEVITSASGGSVEQFTCNYRVTHEVPGGQGTFESGTAITIETYCTAVAGSEAFIGKTGDRGSTETVRVKGERLIIEEGTHARTASGQPNPDNPHRNGVFSSFFPGEDFRLFEKEWLLLNPQIVTTIVVLTNERDAVTEKQRYGVDDAEVTAGALAKRHAPRRTDCKIPTTITASLGGTKKKSGGGSKTPLVVGVAGAAGATAIAIRRRRKGTSSPKAEEEPDIECDELMARFERMMEARLRIRGQLEAGVQSLNRANAAQRNMADAYRDLESEHSKAMLLLGAAGVGAVAALGLVAGSCAAVAAKATAAFEFWSASHMSMWGPSLMSDYLVVNGAAPQAVAAGVRALGTSAARNYAAAQVAGTGAVASVGYVEWFRQKFNSGLTETKAAMDQALQLRNGLESVCRDKERELNRLQGEMNGVRDRLRGCPDVEILFLPEHVEEPIYIESNWASRGAIRG